MEILKSKVIKKIDAYLSGKTSKKFVAKRKSRSIGTVMKYGFNFVRHNSSIALLVQ